MTDLEKLAREIAHRSVNPLHDIWGMLTDEQRAAYLRRAKAERKLGK